MLREQKGAQLLLQSISQSATLHCSRSDNILQIIDTPRLYPRDCLLAVPANMWLTSLMILGRRHGTLEGHVKIAENTVSQIFKTVTRMGRVVIIRPTINNQLVITVDGIV